ncbi:MAG: glycosyltransferase family 2 protein [Candidatus Altiarchaeota archaeon]
MVKVSLIIPTLNEEKSIGNVLKELQGIADEIILVDGHSKDKTVEEAERFNVKVLYDEVGKGSALRRGFAEASGDIIVMLDADEAHGRDEVIKVIDKIREGYAVCMPSRFLLGGGSEDITPLRVIGNDFYKFWVRLFWGVSYTDICYGFRGFTRAAIQTLNLQADGFDIETEIAIKTAKKKLKYTEIPSKEGKRKHGQGKLNFWTSLTIDKRIIKELLSK